MHNISIEKYRKEILKSLSDVIAINSAKSQGTDDMPFGKGVYDALKYMLDLAGSLGIYNVNLDSYCGYAEIGEGKEELDILTHLDVVPAGDGWTYEPFKGTFVGDRIYGRGTMDDKGAAVVALFVLHALKENHVKLKKRIRLIFGCDEETSWQDMDYYRTKFPEEPEMAFSPDSDFPVVNSEKGVFHFNYKKHLDFAEGPGVRLRLFRGGKRVNIVPDYAECFVEGVPGLLVQSLELFMEDNNYDISYEKHEKGLFVSARGISAHGSMPEDGLNAIMVIVAFLNNLPLKKSAGSDLVYILGEKIGFSTDGGRLGIKCSDSTGGLTLNVGMIDINDADADVAMDIRYPSCTSQEEIISKINEYFCGFDFIPGHCMVPHYVAPDSELIKKLSEAYKEVTGEKAVCLSKGGATFARTFKNSVAFGPVFPGRECREHSSDEYILIEDLLKAGDIMISAIIKLCS